MTETKITHPFSLLQPDKEVYLGDGLYASFDGYQVMLRAPRGIEGDHRVYLDDDTLRAFAAYLAGERT